MAEKRYFAAVCGIKNSGKTTLLEKIVHALSLRGYRAAVIKHDGHEFSCDIPGTDSWRYMEAGACGAAVFSKRQTFVRKVREGPSDPGSSVHMLVKSFPEADVILAEGCKGLPLRKIEVVRSAVSQRPVSNPEGRFLLVSDLSQEHFGERTLPFESVEEIVDAILEEDGILQEAAAAAGDRERKNPDRKCFRAEEEKAGQASADPAGDTECKSPELACTAEKKEKMTPEYAGSAEEGEDMVCGSAGLLDKERDLARDFTHFDESGRARMVNVGEKDITLRTAVAKGRVLVNPETFSMISGGGMKKGDVLGTAQIAGIMGAKRTSDLIPMCHPVAVDGIRLDLVLNEADCAVDIRAEVTCQGRTGVEMEALTAVSTAALTVYDMCKAVQRDITITQICLEKKTGGVHGDYERR